MPPKKTDKSPTKLRDALALNAWILSLFGVRDFASIADTLRDPSLEGWDNSGESRFSLALRAKFHSCPGLSEDSFKEYDQNIFRHTSEISKNRGDGIGWKYFQYLSLLFVEIYLDRYFADSGKLLAELNGFLAELNVSDPGYSAVSPFSEQDLRKVAIWSATGSGKTLLMHVNILQYRHYLGKHSRTAELNRTIVLTPKEGLSKQHEKELRLSGFWAETFDRRAAGTSREGFVDVIDIHKIEEKAGDKTVAIESFESNNLVLVDEGHRGSAGDDWKNKREKLCENGFSFEYSATFEQAVHASGGKKRNELLSEYSKSVLVDYSYRHFYGDGYGKDYRILNVSDARDGELSHAYLVGAMLTFYEQLLVFGSDPSVGRFNIEKPLAVFVGSTVNAVRNEAGGKVSDVVMILKFFESLLREPERTKTHIGNVLEGKDGIGDGTLFLNRFQAVKDAHRSSDGRIDVESVYLDFLAKAFNCRVPGSGLHVENLKGRDGEIALRAGNGEPFGVVNVGDTAELLKLCESEGMVTVQKDFSESLFGSIGSRHSTVNVLIGAKKFSEGWSSWRVSTMGLMNVGRSEGSEIIQLFGRGVRLKGLGGCLRRSKQLEKEGTLERGSAGNGIRLLETLCVFGLRSDYMQKFREYLEAEGVPSSDVEEIRIRVADAVPESDKKKLKCLSVSGPADFRKTPGTIRLSPDPRLRVSTDWYAKVQSIESSGERRQASRKETQSFSSGQLEFIDWDEAYFELQRQKSDRSWHSLSVTPNGLRELFDDHSWYVLYAPAPLMEFRYGNVRVWNEMAIALLKSYAEALYNLHKGIYYRDRMAVVPLSEHGGNSVVSYEIRVDPSEAALISAVKSVARDVSEGNFRDSGIPEGFSSIHFDRHLYTPLLTLASDVGPDRMSISPVPLNEGERTFVSDLRSYFLKSPELLAGKEIFLLRNLSRKGIGFFEAHNFYPDFILWVLEGNRQRVVFVDPKGLRNVDGGFDNPKLRLYETLKAMPIGDPDVELDSYILSVTPFRELRHWKGQDGESDFEARHVVFQTGNYVERMLRRVFGPQP